MVTAISDTRRQTERIARGVVVVATVWYALALGWCLFARVGNGHDALTASRGMMAENMIRWGIWGPVREYTLDRPGTELYYTHHPFGTYWLVSLFARVLGRHEYVPRLVPVLMSVASPSLIYTIARRLWDPVSGAIAAAAYVVLPITLAFGNLAGFEVPTVFACLLTTWGYIRFSERWQIRWMLVSLFGVVWGCFVDWNYVIFAATAIGGLVLFYVLLPTRWFGRIRLLPFARWALLAAAIAAVTVAGWFWYFHKINAIDTLLQSDFKRTRGSELPLDGVLGARRYWIDVTFTPLAVTLGKIAFPILVVRVFLARRANELWVLAIWVMAFVTYTKFKNGADVHIYWPFAFGAYFAFALGLLAWTAMGLARWIMARIRRPDRHGVVPILALGIASIVPLLILPDGLEGIRYARETGGRFNEKGARDFRDVDKAEALEWMATRMAPDTVVEMHDGMKSTWANDWALHHKVKGFPSPPNTEAPAIERYYLADLEFLPSADQKKMFDTFKVVIVDHFAMVDRSAPQGPVDAYVFDERQPTLLEWYLAYGTQPVRTVRPDAWATWEFRNAWGQAPNPIPTATPETLEQVRIQHNIGVATGDAAAAQQWQEKLVSRIDTAVTATYADGTRLMGQKYTAGIAPELKLFFRAAGTPTYDVDFAISSVIDQRKAWSLVPADDRVKQLGAPFPIPTSYWRVGFIYEEACEIIHRAGRERFAGRFDPAGKAPKLLDGATELPLLVIQ
jgi:4-amino-4-deoxy-L-arabinose transferase-like glycosyltransferase